MCSMKEFAEEAVLEKPSNSWRSSRWAGVILVSVWTPVYMNEKSLYRREERISPQKRRGRREPALGLANGPDNGHNACGGGILLNPITCSGEHEIACKTQSHKAWKIVQTRTPVDRVGKRRHRDGLLRVVFRCGDAVCAGDSVCRMEISCGEGDSR